jgi:hypothetical protein
VCCLISFLWVILVLYCDNRYACIVLTHTYLSGPFHVARLRSNKHEKEFLVSARGSSVCPISCEKTYGGNCVHIVYARFFAGCE